MKQTLYLCIDDTDELGYPKSTGMLAEMIANYISQHFAPCTFIGRHQLLLDERIDYTSHNSSMSFSTQVEKSALPDIIRFAEDLLLKESAPSAEAGFCAVFEDEIKNVQQIIQFGLRAKNEVIEKAEALAVAEKNHIYLKPLTNEGRGVIGALAGLGLRLTGEDGRVKGKAKPPKPLMSVAEILDAKLCDRVLDEDFNPIDRTAMVQFKDKIKLVIKHHQAVLLAKQNDDGIFMTFDIDTLRAF
ncbi:MULTISPECIES: thiamine biosynthesis protein ThiG [Glaesserella]|uniref:Thiamine biosynthesis protein ThiG n=1 Tax=Glaesserella australis TaxID=2094024 RepID=A0A328C1B5_9PAST|nr:MULTISPECIES: thiamine biosynthesis protein ThiG [Glaesserella]AUI65996.1 thiamine biosynthesis protein ThiG [Glaesserella sp. 15-184]RAL18284.1 thiamine biosynthesis protein ThiG [Glaesserella australis]